MGDDDELRALAIALDQLEEARDVGVVERRVDLVEHVERRRAREHEREQERERAERALAAREQPHRRQPLAGGLDLELDARLGGLVRARRRALAGLARLAPRPARASVSTQRPRPPGKSVPTTSSKPSCTCANVVAKRSRISRVRLRMTRSSSRIAAARSSTCVRTSSRRSRCSSSSCLASGLTAPSSPRRRSSRSTRADKPASSSCGSGSTASIGGEPVLARRARRPGALSSVRRSSACAASRSSDAGARSGVALGARVLGLVAARSRAVPS